MLNLTRRINETIIIGDDITVTVTAIKGNQVRLSFTAPRDTPIHREEIYWRIQNEKMWSDLEEEDAEEKRAVIADFIARKIPETMMNAL